MLWEEGEILDSVENLIMFFAEFFFVIMALLAGGCYTRPGIGFPEYGTPSDSFPRPSCETSEVLIRMPVYGPRQPGQELARPGIGFPEYGTPSDSYPRPSCETSEASIAMPVYGPRQPGQELARPGIGFPEYGTPSDSFPRPSCEASEGSIATSMYGPRQPEQELALPRGQVVTVLSKANPDFCLAIRDDSSVLVHRNPNDESQQWVMDEAYSEVDRPFFSLVNKATGQALKHGLGESQPVLLKQYEPSKLDTSILWTTSGDMGQGFRTIRVGNNILLILDAFHGDKKSGGIKDGNPVVLWSWNKGDNQLWKIVPF